jgi:prolyl oligopeptidase
MRRRLFALLFCVGGLLSTFGVSAQMGIQYPETKTVDHVDIYHGVKVTDPYSWLEDATSPETAKWIQAENKVTFEYLDKIPFRAKLQERLEKLYDYPRFSKAFGRGEMYSLKTFEEAKRGENLFFAKNNGLQNQSVLYVQKGLEGTPEVLLDPNKFSDDATTRLGWFSLSRDGKYAAYGESKGGSDWQEMHVMEVATKRTLSDKLEWIKFAGGAWAGDGFFYSRYEAPEKGKEYSSKNANQKVYFHRVGTQQSQDELAYEDPANPQRFHVVDTTEDERFAIMFIADRGKGLDGNALYYRDLSRGAKTFKPIIPSITNDEYGFVGNVGDKLLLLVTLKSAPNAKLVLVDPTDPDEKNWKTIIPEKPERLQFVQFAGGKIFACYVKDVASRVYVYSPDGTFENEVVLPGPGTAEGFAGRQEDKFVFYTFTSFTYPATIFRYDIAARKSVLYRASEIPGFRSSDYETKQVFYNSKDGTRVPMFLIYKKGLKLDGNNPAWMYGYGTFGVPLSPSFSSPRLALLEQGFVYASLNVRGGGEYGGRWHEAGMKLQRQNSFDDVAAAAEWLIANKYTSPQKLAIYGGTLMAPLINQRPELFKVAIVVGAVLDMLKFHKFTIGWNWATDYGSSENPEEFRVLYAYSPLHNVHAGVKYPATLITTADHDDRVVPAHAFKFAATLQEKAGKSSDAPLLIRIDTKSGYAASTTAKAIKLTADIYAFMMYNLGASPTYEGVASR